MDQSWWWWAGVTMFALVLVRPGSQGAAVTKALGSSATEFVQGITGQNVTA